MISKTIPEGFHSLITDLVVRDVKAAVEFYERAFGAKNAGSFMGLMEASYIRRFSSVIRY